MKIIKGLPKFEANPEQYIGIDTEFTGMNSRKLHIAHGTFASMQVAFENGDVYIIQDKKDIPEMMRRIDRARWIFANAMFDIRQLRMFVSIAQRRVWDIQLIERDLFGGYFSLFNLSALSARWLNEYMAKDVREDFYTATEMTDEMVQYAARDAWATLRIGKAQIEYVRNEQISLDHYWLADLPASWAMEEALPARINVEEWGELADGFSAQAEALKSQLSFNPASVPQTKSALEKAYRVHLSSTDSDSLAELIEKKPDVGLAQTISDYRSNAKLSSTYGRNWLTDYVEGDGYIRSEWKICGAPVTGRMASGEPNLQNVPSRKMPIFREKFIPHPKHEIMVADVAQQEPRILAKFSMDKKMTQMILSGKSIHVALGEILFSAPDFSKKDSRYPIAKSLNLGLDYGLTASGLARNAGISSKEADKYMNEYFRIFPGVLSYMDSQRRMAARNGYVRTMLGRRCWVNPHVYKWKNNAINSPIQGTAAEQMKMAIAYFHELCAANNRPFSLMMVVHDEMVMSHPAKLHKVYTKFITEAWNEAGLKTLGDSIPVVLEIETGESWACKNG